MNIIKLDSGNAVNLSHVVLMSKTAEGGLLYCLGMPTPIEISEDDFFTISQITEYTEAKLLMSITEFTPLTIEKSMRTISELLLHFVAQNLAIQSGTLQKFPTEMVYERIANIMNELNNSSLGDMEVSSEELEEKGKE